VPEFKDVPGYDAALAFLSEQHGNAKNWQGNMEIFVTEVYGVSAHAFDPEDRNSNRLLLPESVDLTAPSFLAAVVRRATSPAHKWNPYDSAQIVQAVTYEVPVATDQRATVGKEIDLSVPDPRLNVTLDTTAPADVLMRRGARFKAYATRASAMWDLLNQLPQLIEDPSLSFDVGVVTALAHQHMGLSEAGPASR